MQLAQFLYKLDDVTDKNDDAQDINKDNNIDTSLSNVKTTVSSHIVKVAKKQYQVLKNLTKDNVLKNETSKTEEKLSQPKINSKESANLPHKEQNMATVVQNGRLDTNFSSDKNFSETLRTENKLQSENKTVENGVHLTSFNPNSTQLTPFVSTESNSTQVVINKEYEEDNLLGNKTDYSDGITNGSDNSYTEMKELKGDFAVTRDYKRSKEDTNGILENDSKVDSDNMTERMETHSLDNGSYTQRVTTDSSLLMTTSAIPIIPDEESQYTPVNVSQSITDKNSTDTLNTQQTILKSETNVTAETNKASDIKNGKSTTTSTSLLKKDDTIIKGHPKSVWLSFFPVDRSKRNKHPKEDIIESKDVYSKGKEKKNKPVIKESKEIKNEDLKAELENLKFNTETPEKMDKVLNTKVPTLDVGSKVEKQFTLMHNKGAKDNVDSDKESKDMDTVTQVLDDLKKVGNDDLVMKAKANLDRMKENEIKADKVETAQGVTQMTKTGHVEKEETYVTTAAFTQEVGYLKLQLKFRTERLIC